MATTNGTQSHDLEKGEEQILGDENGSKLEGTSSAEWNRESPSTESWNRRLIDSFKRDPNAHVTKAAQGVDARAGKGGFDHKTAAERTANSGLAQKLKSRHMQMIAIGGSIGRLLPTAGEPRLSLILMTSQVLDFL
jgi:amino acid transporter